MEFSVNVCARFSKFLQPELKSAVAGIYRKGKSFMKVLDPLPSIVAPSDVGGRLPVGLVESAFPIATIPGFWEILRKFRSEQGNQELRSDVDPEDCNRFV